MSCRAAQPARWLRDRATEQAAVLGDMAGLGLPVRSVGYASAEPTGVGVEPVGPPLLPS